MTSPFTLSPEAEQYLGSVREHMVLRGMQPDAIGAHLEEMASHLAETGRSPLDEYGVPATYAESVVATQETPRWARWTFMIGTFLSTFFLILAITYLGVGGDEGVLSGEEVADLLPFGFIGVIGNTVGMVKVRDRVRGVPIESTGDIKKALLLGVALFVAVVAASVILRNVFEDTQVGWTAVNGWTMAAISLALAAVIGWFTVVKPTLPPRFPTGSLKAGVFTRKVRSNQG